jgi:hypothetical protein
LVLWLVVKDTVQTKITVEVVFVIVAAFLVAGAEHDWGHSYFSPRAAAEVTVHRHPVAQPISKVFRPFLNLAALK